MGNILLQVVPLNRGGITWVLKAVDGSGEYNKDDDGKDKGLYCQHY